MGWSPAISSGDVVAIHAALIPTANGDGEILLFGGDNHDLNAARLGEGGDTKQFDHARRFNCRHPEQALEYVHSPIFDVFCCGHAFLGDGRLLVAGGTLKFPADAAGPHHNMHFEGHRHAAVYALEEQERYAAVWEKDNGPAFVARHGLTPQAYQQEFDHWIGQGYRLKLVDGYSVAGQERYAAVWDKQTGPPFVARHGMNPQQYQQEFNAHVGAGFRLRLVSGYNVAGEERYAAIWEKDNGPAFIARHGMTSQHQDRYAAIWEQKSAPPFVARHGMSSQAYQQEFNTLVGQGYRLKLVSGYSASGQDRYAAIWEKSAGPQWVARHGMTPQQYQQEFNTFAGQGFRLKLVSGYSAAGQELYAAIWEKDNGPAFVARHGMTSQQYQQEFNTHVSQGFRLVWVSGYRHGPDERYAAIWEQ